jgi:hypothetical protein
MQRRQFNVIFLAPVAGLLIPGPVACALEWADVTNVDATKSLRLMLDKGAQTAVALLGTTNGFLGNDKVRIPLPSYLQDASSLLRTFGLGGQLDELVTAMNRGAEAAIPLARDLLTRTVRGITVSDAKAILEGGDTAVSQFFEQKTRSELGTKFLPIVTKATAKLGLATQYNQLAGRAADFGLVKPEDANLEKHVTAKALDGLYLMISEEEKKIRQNPVAYGSALLNKVLGALQ